MTQKSDRDLYFVAVKIFLEQGDKFLIFKDKFGDWDIPGGRIQKHEFSVPLEKILRRKMHEELGRKIKYRLGKPIVLMRHERLEMRSKEKEKVRIFAIGFEAKFLGGPIRLSNLHTEYLWVSQKFFRPEKYFKGGWLKGVKEYLAVKRKSPNATIIIRNSYIE